MKNSDMTTDLLTAVQTEPTITSSQVRCEETNLTKSLIDGTNASMAGLKLKNAENSMRINQQISVITTTSNEIEDQEKDTVQKEKSEKSKLILYRSSHRRCSVTEGVLRNFAKFTGKHLCQSLFFNFFFFLISTVYNIVSGLP